MQRNPVAFRINLAVFAVDDRGLMGSLTGASGPEEPERRRRPASPGGTWPDASTSGVGAKEDMMRRTIITAVVLALVVTPLLATGAGAVPPSPNHHVVRTLGRRLVAINHFGDPNRGVAQCSAQGELIDSNNNQLADALRGRVACLESSKVTRFRIYSVRLEVFFAETWRPVAIDDQDVVSSNNPAYVVNYTPVPGFCPQNIVLTYRVRQTVGIRWSDGTLGNHSVISNQFQARAVVNTQVC
jgi:hypothetical protein